MKDYIDYFFSQALLDSTGNSHIKFTTKSFKVTGVTEAFHADVPTDKIKLLGRWASESVINRYRYILHFSREIVFNRGIFLHNVGKNKQQR